MFVSVLMSLLILVASVSTPTPEPTLAPPNGDPHCWDHATTDPAMQRCAGENARDADAAMNVAFQQLMKRAPDAGARKKLQAAQTAWMTYRKAELAAKYPADNPESAQQKYGTVWPMCAVLDYVEMTRARTAELHRLLSVREGDVCAGAYAHFL